MSDTKQEARDAAKAIRKNAVGENRIDKRDMLKLAKMLEQGKYAEAYKFWREMDTFVREGIPEVAVRFLYMNRAKTKLVVEAFVTLKGCNKVFRDGFPPGCVAKYTWGMPGNATKEEQARWILGWQEKVIEDTVEVKLGKVKRVKE